VRSFEGLDRELSGSDCTGQNEGSAKSGDGRIKEAGDRKDGLGVVCKS